MFLGIPLSPRRLSILLILGWSLASSRSTLATSITGGGETVESTPTPNRGFATPSPTPGKSFPRSESSTSLPTPDLPTPARNNEPARPIKTVKPSDQIVPEAEPSATPVNEFIGIMQSAAEDFKNRKFEDAFKKIQKAEALQPNNADVLNFRGAIYAETGQFAEAKTLYEKALLTQPTSFWPRFNLAEIEFMQQKYPEARTGFEKTMEKFPDNELLRFKIVLTYIRENNTTAAKSELERFRFPSETAAYYFAWAAWEFSQNNERGAKEWMDSAVRIFGRERTDFVYQSLADLKYVPLPRP